MKLQLYTHPMSPCSQKVRIVLAEKGLAGARMGVELDSYGLRAHDYERLKTTLNGWCELEDASSLVRGLRLIKSETELAYVRRAAELADASLLAMPGRCLVPAIGRC